MKIFLLSAALIVTGSQFAYSQCCGRSGPSQGRGITTFKGGAARLPTVTAVGDNEITVADKKTYLVGESTRITIDGKRATFDELKTGMAVNVSGTKVARGPSTKDSLFRARQITARTR